MVGTFPRDYMNLAKAVDEQEATESAKEILQNVWT